MAKATVVLLLLSLIYNSYGQDNLNWVNENDLGDMVSVININIPSISSIIFNTLVSDIENSVSFKLFTKFNKKDRVIMEYNGERLPYLFDKTKPTKIITHGFVNDGNSPACLELKDSYLEYHDVNVIIVDWGPISKNPIYMVPLSKVKSVGEFCGMFGDNLISLGVDPKSIHIIGHSLGAHVSGVCSRSIRKGKIARVTGLDPAGPGFSPPIISNSELRPTDADFVDSIHTCMGIYGVAFSNSQADFYPNGGIPPMPGCIGIDKVVQACSHYKAVEYFKKSLIPNSSLTAIQCESMQNYNDQLCNDNPKAIMGYAAGSSTKGNYYLQIE